MQNLTVLLCIVRKCKFLLDGFPREIEQAIIFEDEVRSCEEVAKTFVSFLRAVDSFDIYFWRRVPLQICPCSFVLYVNWYVAHRRREICFPPPS